jgi:hypothetical protein
LGRESLRDGATNATFIPSTQTIKAMVFDCPVPNVLPEIPANDCPFKIDQIVRAAFQLRQLDGEPFSPTNAITKKASWATLVSATDETKIVFTPIFASLTIPQSEGKEEGGNDNSTAFGIPEYVGENSVKVESEYKNIAPAVVAALRKLVQQSIPQTGSYRLTVFLFTKNGQILCIETKEAAVTKHSGNPLFNLRFSSRGSEGFNASDKVKQGWYFPSDWDEKVALITPEDFNPLTDF